MIIKTLFQHSGEGLKYTPYDACLVPVLFITAGVFNTLDVLISTGGDVIFFIGLPTIYTQPVSLFLKYISADDPSRSYNRTTGVAFLNTASIQHVEYSSQVAYDQFLVQAGLVSGGVHGPLYDAPGMYGKLVTPVCDVHQLLSLRTCTNIPYNYLQLDFKDLNMYLV